jgi:hypothetical protein
MVAQAPSVELEKLQPSVACALCLAGGMDVHVRFERKKPAIPAGKPAEKLHD